MSKTLNDVATLDWLYSRIPSFICKEGCTDCCGPVHMTKTRIGPHHAAQAGHVFDVPLR